MMVKEAITFHQKRDPKEALNVSIKPEIEEWLDKFRILWMCEINDDMTIDCKDFLGLTNNEIENFPNFIRFNKAKGFSCSKNNLTSLRGCPKIVYGNFYCYANNLTSLEGSPKEVTGNYVCHNNPGNFTEDDVKAVCNVHGIIDITGEKF